MTNVSLNKYIMPVAALNPQALSLMLREHDSILYILNK